MIDWQAECRQAVKTCWAELVMYVQGLTVFPLVVRRWNTFCEESSEKENWLHRILSGSHLHCAAFAAALC